MTTGPDIAAGALPRGIRGWCSTCRSRTSFTAHQPWLRDHFLCDSCGSVPRQRHVQHVLDTRFPGWEDAALHEGSPSNAFLERASRNFSSSQLFADVPLGEHRGPVRCEDLERLTYADASLDLVVTQDVLEHVFHPDRAVAEVHRVLRPGGAHVFTAPKHRHLPATVQRARLVDGEVEHLLPAEYHGNPVADGEGEHQALVTFDYGGDFEELLSTWAGGASVETVHTVDRTLGLDAEFLEVFVIRKPGATWEQLRAAGSDRQDTPRERRGRLARVAGRVLRAIRR